MTNKTINWIDRRFPFSSFVKHDLTEYPTPRNLSYWWNFGFLAGFVLVLQVATGVFLAMHYKADAGLSFDSVQHIMRDVNYGWLLRFMHATGASAFFLVIYIHMAAHALLRLLPRTARADVVDRTGIAAAVDGNRFHGLSVAVGANVVLGRNRDHQSV